MLSRCRPGSQGFVLLACSVLLAILLPACGGEAPPPALTTTSTPSSTARMITYKGDGYSIAYPSAWKVNAQGTRVTFAVSTGIYNLTIVVSPNPGGVASADTVASAGIKGASTHLKNAQNGDLPATTIVGGDSWMQKSTTGVLTTSSGVTMEFAVLADNHPASSSSTISYMIIYGTTQDLFSSSSSSYFQPMLQSFKFTL